jgi:hypothetical protein
MTVAGWVRQTLRAARRKERSGDPKIKLAAVREAMKYAYPTGNIEQILGDIDH